MFEKHFEGLEDFIRGLQFRDDFRVQGGTCFLELISLNWQVCCVLREPHEIHFISLTMMEGFLLSY